MLKRLSLLLVLAIAAAAGPALAAADPSIDQVYEQARSGHLTRALEMMDQVLRDHPQSAKAHYVMADLYAQQGETARAREQLDTAERLAPGLPFAKRDAVRELERKLSGTPRTHASSTAAPRSFSPGWGTLIVVVIAGGALWMLFRRRSLPAQGPAQYVGGGIPPAAAPPGATGATMAPAASSSGIGSAVAGGLAGGLAAGAGIVAGEAIAHRLFGSESGESVAPSQPAAPLASTDDELGGQDFGISDDSSWDDNSGTGDASSNDVGGDDWT